MSKNTAASELARKRWAKTPSAKERSAIMKRVRAGAKTAKKKVKP